ncbi:hypothetical protein COCON_G00195950 [Conger conger]|uniref:Uncharacterized protein n=1 Tax=Conger conger TaxID=82655 RepID=A0A9Q1D125_CONCO|nr:hypothetical protein COCON_G00195950 [Conger conger]
MDVRISLSVSLLRDQLGTVIEQAVTNAVETVLGEMLKVLRDGTAIKDQVIAVKESQDTHSSAPNLHPKDYIHIKEEHRDPLERPGGCHSREGFCETEPSQGGSTEVHDFDPSLHKLDNIAVTTMGASPQAKEEEAEMQLICIKEEPPELEIHTLSPQPPDRLSDPCPDQGGGQDRAGPTDCLMGTALPTMSSPTSGWDGQARRGGIRPQGELQTLRQQRAELQRRSQLRRRERERSLPQALQVAMERERREKTRIRVARWRAKRKMQAAGLMTSQPTQLDYGLAQSVQMHANDALRCRQQYGSLMYGSAQYENGALYPPLHIGQELTDALVQSEVTVVQQGILGSDSELFQQSEFEA